MGMSTPGKSLFTMVVPSSIRNSRSRTPLLNSNSLILAAPSRPCTCWFMSGLGHVCEMHKVKEKYIEDIQWFDVEYGLYFTSKTGFFIFSRVQNINETLSHDWNKFHIRRKIIELSVYESFIGGIWTGFFRIIDTACNTWRYVTKAFYFHTVEIKHLIFSTYKNKTFDIFKLWK